MESGRYEEVENVCKKMHKHVFDDDDLRQEMKDMYDNFTLIFKATIFQLKNFETKFRQNYYHWSVALGYLITFSRCALRRCVDKGSGVINQSLVHILTDVESQFVDLHERLTAHLSCEDSKLEPLGIGSFENMVPRVSNAYFAVLSTEPFFIHSDESMVEFLDQLMEDIKTCGVYTDAATQKTYLEKLQLLRNYIQFTKDWISRKGLKEILICVEAFAERAACYSFLRRYGKFTSREQHSQIENLWDAKMDIAILEALVLKREDHSTLPPFTYGLLKAYVDCIRKNLRPLLNDEFMANLTALSNGERAQVDYTYSNLQEELDLLGRLILNYPPKHEAELEKLLDIRKRFQDLLRSAGSVVLQCLNQNISSNKERKKSIGLSYLIQMAGLLKDYTKNSLLLITFGRMGQYSPTTNRLGFLNFIIENLEELNDFESGQFRTIHKNIVFFRSFLESTMGNSSMGNDDESKDISNHIKCAAYEAEYLINSYVAGACPDWCRSRWFSDFKQKLKLTKASIVDISEKRENDDSNIDAVSSNKTPSLVQSLGFLPTSEVVVGFEDEMELIKKRLFSDSMKLDVISIFGMPGHGKTTLAKKVYEDASVVDHFQLRAWCTVSQEYYKKELLLTILGSIIQLTDLIRRESDSDLSLMLHQQLMGRRYLIVMDDVWGMEAFEDLKRFFPVNSNGSRVMLTSRYRLQDCSNPLELRLLTHDESWKLMKQTVFQKDEECPPELCQIGQKILEKCRGLPLAIVVVAGILAKSEKKLDFWEKVSGNLSMYIAQDTTQGQVMAALELSYEHLPEHLKPLFLYVGAFPEDTAIPANKLMWLWSAEGFLHKNDKLTTSLEVQAELNLMDLIDRSLVMIAERRSDGRVKSCRVHDLLRDMCLGKAKKENFMKQINVHDEYSPDPVTYERRLSVSVNTRKCDSDILLSCEGLNLLSIPPALSCILLFNLNKSLPLSGAATKSVFRSFRLLKILHSESITVDTNLFRDHVEILVHLRYISIRTDWNLIPSSISKLRNLETLIIRGLKGEIVVPKEIWELVKLRHLHVNDRADFSGAAALESSSKLENLETLSTPAICYEEEKKLIRRVPNLRKLRCIFVEPRNFYRNYYQLPRLESLNQLESLKMLCYGRMAHSGKFGLPSTLKKLTLSKFRLQWSEIASFQKLRNLEVLKLRSGAVEGALWDTGDDEFPKLRYLKLETLDIKQWIVSPENFPCLRKLVLQSCKKLEEIPSKVGDFYSLENIEVLWCSPSAAKSAKQILEEQRDNGNEVLKVQIHMSS